MRMMWKTVSNTLLNSGSLISPEQVSLSYKEIRLLMQNLPFIRQCCLGLILWLFCMCCVIALKMICTDEDDLYRYNSAYRETYGVFPNMRSHASISGASNTRHQPFWESPEEGWSGRWNTSPMKTVWESWDCSDWRRLQENLWHISVPKERGPTESWRGIFHKIRCPWHGRRVGIRWSNPNHSENLCSMN